jgi:hypothetical protein
VQSGEIENVCKSLAGKRLSCILCNLPERAEWVFKTAAFNHSAIPPLPIIAAMARPAETVAFGALAAFAVKQIINP